MVLTPGGASPAPTKAVRDRLKVEGEVVGGWHRFDVEVVDEAGFADFCGEEDVGGVGDACDGIEGVGVYDFGVVELDLGFGGENFLDGGLDGEGVASAGGEFVAGGG